MFKRNRFFHTWLLILALICQLVATPLPARADDQIQVRLRVEGLPTTADTLVLTTPDTCALDVLKLGVGSNNVVAPGGYVTAINSEGSGNNSYWMYYVARGGVIDPISCSTGANDYKTRDGDEVVFYKAAFGSDYSQLTYLPIIMTDPAIPQPGQDLNLTIQACRYDFNSGQLVALTSNENSALGPYTVQVNGHSYQAYDGAVTLPASDITTSDTLVTITNVNAQGYNNVVPYRGQVSGTVSVKAALGATLALADSKLSTGPWGNLGGQYPESAKTALQQARDDANTVYQNTGATVAQLNQARSSLEDAINTFLARVNAPSPLVGTAINQTLTYYSQHKALSNWWDLVALRGVGQNLNSGDWTLPDLQASILNPTTSSVSDYSGVILGMLARGQDPTSVGDDHRNLVQELASRQNTGDGHFGTYLGEHVWAMIALDAAGASYDTTKAVNYLCANQIASGSDSGGFGYGGDTGDVDLTGMVLIALANHRDVSGVGTAISGAVAFLHNKQLATGGFSSYGTDNANSAASAISGLVAVGQDVTGADWSKNGVSALAALERFQTTSGAFSWSFPLTDNKLATQQALIALGDIQAGRSVFTRLGGTSSNDLATLTKALVSAQLKYDTSVEGNGVDQYPAAARQAFKQAIESARAVAADPAASAQDINNAVVALASAISTFDNARITEPGGGNTPVMGTVTLTIKGVNGVVMYPAATVTLQSGDTPFSILVRALGNDVTYKSGTSYVTGILGLKEFDRGAQSGWCYRVNGVVPQVGAGDYQLSSGDLVEWMYTLNLGQDVGATVTTIPEQLLAPVTPPSPATIEGYLSKLSLIPAVTLESLRQSGSAVVVLNTGQAMNATVAQQLQEQLATNQVALSSNVNPTADATLTDSGGEVVLTVPRGALQAARELTVKELPAATNSASGAVSSVYEFGPSGTVFATPVYISIRVPLANINPQRLALAWYDESSKQWVPVPAIVDAATGLVSGRVNHFTRFAVFNLDQITKTSTSIPVDTLARQAAAYLTAKPPLDDWGALALVIAGQPGAENYVSTLTRSIRDSLGQSNRVTDPERQTLLAVALGLDPGQIAGQNLLATIYNNQRLTSQGINGVIYGLLALDSVNCQVPAGALWNQEKMVSWLLTQQQADGSFALTISNSGDVDLTAMTLTALAPYRDKPEVQAAVDRALSWLSGVQLSSGGFENSGLENSESMSQVIIALSTLGIDPDDNRFVKPGGSLLQCWLKYNNPDGSFAHLAGKGGDLYATEQALMALSAYQRFQSGEAGIYQFARVQENGFIDAALISSWARAGVEKARAAGIVKGVQASPPRFAPRDAVTRAELVTMLTRVKQPQTPTGKQATFTDVKPGSWYYESVAAAAGSGWISGYGDGRFAPLSPVTRQELAIMVVRAFPELSARTASSFQDMNLAWPAAVPCIKQLAGSGIMVGNQGRFDPLAPVTREMAATIMARLQETTNK